MQIAKIIAIGEGKNPENILITVEIQKNGSIRKKKYELTEKDYERLGFPAVNQELSEYECRILSKSIHQNDAIGAALRILTQGDNNRASLKRKLLEKGFSEETADSTVERMTALGYIDERKQTYRYVLKLANQNLYGRKRITLFLLNKGYQKEDVDASIDTALERGEIDFCEIKKRLIEKSRLPEENRQEIKALLYKYGHSGDSDF
jgi:SOS response regulatory protein OraA/RecX